MRSACCRACASIILFGGGVARCDNVVGLGLWVLDLVGRRTPGAGTRMDSVLMGGLGRRRQEMLVLVLALNAAVCINEVEHFRNGGVAIDGDREC